MGFVVGELHSFPGIDFRLPSITVKPDGAFHARTIDSPLPTRKTRLSGREKKKKKLNTNVVHQTIATVFVSVVYSLVLGSHIKKRV